MRSVTSVIPPLYPALCLALFLLGCSTASGEHDEARASAELRPPTTAAVLSSITPDDLMRHVEVLASDEYEGRKPGTIGEEKTVAYLTTELKRIGLEPGNPDGTYVQRVPLAGTTGTAEVSMEVGGRAVPMTMLEDVVAMSRHLVPEVRVDRSALVFVGYGVVAPEFGWDDFKGVDVTGKTVVMFVNDPPVRVPAEGEGQGEGADEAGLDPAMFRGRAMTYYGRWTYKYEIATEKGAAAVLIVHEDGPAGYGWGVVRDSWGGENFDLDTPDGNASRVPVEGWLARDAAASLFEAAGHSFEDMKRAALSPEFEPVSLGGTASFRVENRVRRVSSNNVIGLLRGSDPKVADELLVYTAHWDHLGRDETREGDQIFNGALDNATGVAGVLELAEAFMCLDTSPRRSILFMLVTAEEQGLLGSKHYASNPLYPLEKTLANINMDGLNVYGRTRDITVVGYGNSTLEDLLIAAAVQQGRSVKPEAEPEKGYFYRSDHFEFAKRGVPALYTGEGTEVIGKPDGFAEMLMQDYLKNRYHKPGDEILPEWTLDGAVSDLWLFFRVGLSVLYGDHWPEWKPGTEFKALREEMLGTAGT
jgi:Zn-dependent M28 family amino/carboxypeptidase